MGMVAADAGNLAKIDAIGPVSRTPNLQMCRATTTTSQFALASPDGLRTLKIQ
jgi:hypothetical protein